MVQSWQFWALTAIFGKLGVAGIPSDMAVLIRTGVIGLVVLVLVLATGQWVAPRAISGATWGFLILSGLATGASWLAYFRALKLGDAARVAPLDKLSVVMVAVFAAVFLGERLSAVNWLGVGLIALGAVLVALRV